MFRHCLEGVFPKMSRLITVFLGSLILGLLTLATGYILTLLLLQKAPWIMQELVQDFGALLTIMASMGAGWKTVWHFFCRYVWK